MYKRILNTCHCSARQNIMLTSTYIHFLSLLFLTFQLNSCSGFNVHRQFISLDVVKSTSFEKRSIFHSNLMNKYDEKNSILKTEKKMFLKSSKSSSLATDESNVKLSSIVNAALLISGTTIGGGFLALPTVTSTVGFVPSSITLVCVWVYFLLQSFVLVECLEYTRNEAFRIGANNAKNNEQIQPELRNPGVSTVARNMYGKNGEIFVAALLIILMEATLVSQISKAGSLIFGGQHYIIGCVLSSISIALLVFGPKRRGVEFASQMNSYLTFGFLASVLGVFVCGVPNANWNQLGITGTSPVASVMMNVSQKRLIDIIPTFLQLLVYGEIIPCVCQILNYNIKAIRIAIAMGSFLTLCLQIGWSGLGIALMAPLASKASNDVVNILLQSGGTVQLPLSCLSITAILTTILGSYLALLTMCNNIYQDLFKGGHKVRGRSNTTTTKDESLQSTSTNTILQRITVGSMITLPALSISSTSPSIFLKAIDFAGSYPVLLLWGILPTFTTLLQRRRWNKDKSGKKIGRFSKTTSSGSSLWISLLALISCSMIGLSAKDDLTTFISRFQS